MNPVKKSQKEKAVVRMEEGYMRATIPYSSVEYRNLVLSIVSNITKETKLHPECIERQDTATKGFITVEFSGEEYMHRDSGDYITKLLHTLDIDYTD
ncbi:MAG TPA: hypothetical protein ENK87_00465 [Nitratifractor sp.]|jgi:hypothetical protein|nr:hypothetical protein [Nitratifractor sp.]HHD74668.1 hypothetical protein [Nitratifractor sp.]HHH20378.1 hypothetical protein [Nitratifractor sp.]